MKRGRRIVMGLTLTFGIALSVFGTAGIASATKGSPRWCANHPTEAPTVPACNAGGSGTGGSTPQITVQIDPTPLVETGESSILATIQVETSAAFAGDPVDISSSQLSESCATTTFFNLQATGPDNVSVILDDDGNATVLVIGQNCAPGSDLVEADLVKAPYYTAVGSLEASPPTVTSHGLIGYPTTSGIVSTGEVETGDTPASGESDVYAVFYVETNPVFAESSVSISSAQLEARCGGGWTWASLAGGPHSTASGTGINMGSPARGIIDDDGNAVFYFEGSSCAAGPSLVLSGGRTTTFTINPPQVTL